MAVNFFDLELAEIQRIMKHRGQPSYRADQIWQGLYREIWLEADRFSTLPQSLRDRLAEEYDFGQLEKEQELRSSDGLTRK